MEGGILTCIRGLFTLPPRSIRMVAIAQLVEHRIVVPRVVGSSPISHPILPTRRSRQGAAAPLAPDRGFTPPERHFLSFQQLDALWMHQ